MFGNHGLGGLLEEGAPKCLGGNLGDFGEFCKGLRRQIAALPFKPSAYPKQQTGEKALTTDNRQMRKHRNDRANCRKPCL
ncbi:hypothetical protein COI02_09355 [Neisseria meningitidis]|nr:hypothetical protein COI02_09355 [Neisseria meningitidis]RQK12805.1 hypothetical protein COH80_08050 [Neisseria meningitidis]RQK84694.1 hypothetical protein COH50_07910 [Neisseria meningitidis]RQK96879.1 hypothetical protein COH43_09365 [Neisseria meningitidis]RQL25807.1 hypothetical protein COH30_08525 [Neisseria meningitidis]